MFAFYLQECKELNISFHLLVGHAKDVLPSFIKDYSIGGVVTDFSPLRVPRGWVDDVLKALPKDIAICQVGCKRLLPKLYARKSETNMPV